MIYLLDTNAWSKYLNDNPSPVRDQVRQAGWAQLRISTIVMAEMLYGAYHGRNVESNLALLANLFRTVAPVSFDAASAACAGHIRAVLAAAGTPIGPNDLLIAATAVAHGMVLVTHNTREFMRVPALAVEDWEL